MVTNNSANYKPVLHDVLVGAANGQITSVAPSSTSGVPLISQGASSDPAFGTALVGGGGTGATSFNTNGVVISNTSGTGALASLSLSSGQVVIGGTSTPAAATLSSGAGISISNGNNSITIAASGSGYAYTNVNNAASPYTVLSTDYYISVDCSAGAVTLRFPNAPTAKQSWIVKDRTGNAATNNITITTPGGTVTFDGGTSYVMNVNYRAVNLIANSTPTYEVF